jgi:hypothetical protein
MKKLLLLFPVLFVVFGFISSKLIDDKVNKLLKQFNTSEDNAKQSILSDITGPSYYIPNLKMLKEMALNERTEVVTTLGNAIKDYLKSDDFIKKYNEFREGKKPTEPETPKYAAQLNKDYVDNLKKSISEMETNAKKAPADQKAMFEDLIKQFRQQLKDAENPETTPYKPEMDEYLKQAYEQQMESYKSDVAQWKVDYPVNNPVPLIKKWISGFLENSKNIDFKAELKTKNGQQVFVNPELERKDYQWKLYFRAGKQTVEAARKFAQDWLATLK